MNAFAQHVTTQILGRDAQSEDPDAMAAILEHALRVMRGNRSSNRVTYFLADGAARVLAARALDSRGP